LYAHKVRSPSWWHDINTPEQFGFASQCRFPIIFNTMSHSYFNCPKWS
jgi:hypothetical protein